MLPKVIIDTDAGCDDAFAIFMALEAHKQNKIKICAITTVNGNTSVDNVNKNVIRILHTAGQLQIPIYSGAAQPLVCPFQFPEVPFHGFDGFGDAKHDEILSPISIKKEFAPLAIVRLIEEYPGQIILVALGPLTNIAISLNIKPNLTENIKDFYIMGGNISGVGNITLMGEFNFVCDPEAAKVVLGRTLKPIKMAPWETCFDGVNISYEEREKMSATQTSSAKLINMIEGQIMHRRKFNYYITCDQMAVAWMLNEWTDLFNDNETPLVIQVDNLFATVELSGEHSRGLMICDNLKRLERNNNVIVMKKVNKDVYLKYLQLAFQ